MTKSRCGRTMPALLLAGGAVACLVAGLAWFWPSPPERSLDGASPRIVLSQTECDLGAVPQGTVVHATFPVRNAGRRSLLLFEKKGGCCGQAEETRIVRVPPGESALLRVEFDTAQAFGQFQETVRYATNDRRKPSFVLRLRGRSGTRQSSVDNRCSEVLATSATAAW